MENIQGSCRCGAIHYQSTSEPSMMAVSDGRLIQNDTGTADSVSVGVPSDRFRVKGLQPTVYEDVKESGSVVLRSFCPNCGTTLFTESESEPTMVFVTAASLDDQSWIQSRVTSITPWRQPGIPSVTRYRRSPKIVELPARELQRKVS